MRDHGTRQPLYRNPSVVAAVLAAVITGIPAYYVIFDGNSAPSSDSSGTQHIPSPTTPSIDELAAKLRKAATSSSHEWKTGADSCDVTLQERGPGRTWEFSFTEVTVNPVERQDDGRFLVMYRDLVRGSNSIFEVGENKRIPKVSLNNIETKQAAEKMFSRSDALHKACLER